MKKELFREDIQGLRGLAIFFVIAFHFFPKILPYGYLGVDIFFVISGYLVTKIILIKKNFSFLNFFLGRLNRILPPMIFTIIICGILSYLLFLPLDFNNFWNSVFFSLFFFPNAYFFLSGGYFGGINELKPLLHFWSLGVELQFYFFFPIFIFLIRNIKNLGVFFFILFFSSLLLNFFFTNSNLSFFILPFRAWEFGIGAIIFLLPKIKINYFYKYITYFISFFFLFFFIFTKFHFLTDFMRQFLVCLFASVLIYLGNEIKKNFYLNNLFLQFFGKISFSLYLLHWPILVFIKYYLVREIVLHESLIILLLSILLSFLFCIHVENKFRYKIKFNQSFKYLSILYFVIIITFFFNKINKNFPQRFDKEIVLFSNSLNSNYRCNIISYFNFFHNRQCEIINNKLNLNFEVALLGNSHAQMYGYGFEKFLESKKLNGLIIPLNSCLPTITINISKDCIVLAKKNLNTILTNDFKHVFIGLNWSNNFMVDINGVSISDKNNEILANSLSHLISIIVDQNIGVSLIGPISTPNYEFVSVESRNLNFNHKKKFNNYIEKKNEFEKRFAYVLEYFNNKKSVRFVKPHEIQCVTGYCLFSILNESLFSDGNHLSKFGSMLMYDIFEYN